MQNSFIESQFPVSRISKECYKERKAGNGQTITGLGKWWGRKPLLLVRASIVGLLMPASSNPRKDREIFLKILTMDNQGVLRRKKDNFTQKEMWLRLPEIERKKWFASDSNDEKPRLKKLAAEEKKDLNAALFARLGYDEKIEYCARPEEIDGPDEDTWNEINAHLGTTAKTLPELIE